MRKVGATGTGLPKIRMFIPRATVSNVYPKGNNKDVSHLSCPRSEPAGISRDSHKSVLASMQIRLRLDSLAQMRGNKTS